VEERSTKRWSTFSSSRGQIGQSGERGVTRAEVVDGDADTAVVERLEELHGLEEIDGRRSRSTSKFSLQVLNRALFEK
jgi:hypothetical protein